MVSFLSDNLDGCSTPDDYIETLVGVIKGD